MARYLTLVLAFVSFGSFASVDQSILLTCVKVEQTHTGEMQLAEAIVHTDTEGKLFLQEVICVHDSPGCAAQRRRLPTEVTEDDRGFHGRGVELIKEGRGSYLLLRAQGFGGTWRFEPDQCE